MNDAHIEIGKYLNRKRLTCSLWNKPSLSNRFFLAAHSYCFHSKWLQPWKCVAPGQFDASKFHNKSDETIKNMKMKKPFQLGINMNGMRAYNVISTVCAAAIAVRNVISNRSRLVLFTSIQNVSHFVNTQNNCSPHTKQKSLQLEIELKHTQFRIIHWKMNALQRAHELLDSFSPDSNTNLRLFELNFEAI